MKHFGIVSYNMYCNFTNYGSALQSYALQQSINRLGQDEWESILVDYCPDSMADKDPLNPFKNMWDKDEESYNMCQMSMPAIRENYKKFNDFYNTYLKKSKKKYTSGNFNDVLEDEKLNGFVCGSDTIFCPDEFGFDDGFYANYDCMKNSYSVAYAASFGDPNFTDEMYPVLNERLKNFKAFGLRENLMIPYVKEHTDVPVERVIDPTLLLTYEDYNKMATERLVSEKYLLVYSRRYNPVMEAYAEKMAKENGWKIVEISLRACNAEKGHIMFYHAGVEEFLSLVKHAEFVVTNSFHGIIFSTQFKRDYVIFSREQCNTKIQEVLDLFGVPDRIMVTGDEPEPEKIDYVKVHERIGKAREKSLRFLKEELISCTE